jgi:hypothetical protein
VRAPLILDDVDIRRSAERRLRTLSGVDGGLIALTEALEEDREARSQATGDARRDESSSTSLRDMERIAGQVVAPRLPELSDASVGFDVSRTPASDELRARAEARRLRIEKEVREGRKR